MGWEEEEGDGEEEEIHDGYPPWEEEMEEEEAEEEEEEEKDPSSLEFSSAIKMFTDETKGEEKEEKIDMKDHGGIVAQGVIPVKTSNTEDDTIQNYDKADHM